MARTKKTGLKEKAPAGAPPQKQATLFDSFQEGRPRKAAVVGVRPASETEEDDDYDPFCFEDTQSHLQPGPLSSPPRDPAPPKGKPELLQASKTPRTITMEEDDDEFERALEESRKQLEKENRRRRFEARQMKEVCEKSLKETGTVEDLSVSMETECNSNSKNVTPESSDIEIEIESKESAEPPIGKKPKALSIRRRNVMMTKSNAQAASKPEPKKSTTSKAVEGSKGPGKLSREQKTTTGNSRKRGPKSSELEPNTKEKRAKISNESTKAETSVAAASSTHSKDSIMFPPGPTLWDQPAGHMRDRDGTQDGLEDEEEACYEHSAASLPTQDRRPTGDSGWLHGGGGGGGRRGRRTGVSPSVRPTTVGKKVEDPTAPGGTAVVDGQGCVGRLLEPLEAPSAADSKPSKQREKSMEGIGSDPGVSAWEPGPPHASERNHTSLTRRTATGGAATVGEGGSRKKKKTAVQQTDLAGETSNRAWGSEAGSGVVTSVADSGGTSPPHKSAKGTAAASTCVSMRRMTAEGEGGGEGGAEAPKQQAAAPTSSSGSQARIISRLTALKKRTTAAAARTHLNVSIVEPATQMNWRPLVFQPKTKTPSPSPLPRLFAPDGVSPGEYTPVIIRFFDGYGKHLQVAQRQVLQRVPWGEPVTAGRNQPDNSLDAQLSQRRRRVNQPRRGAFGVAPSPKRLVKNAIKPSKCRDFLSSDGSSTIEEDSDEDFVLPGNKKDQKSPKKRMLLTVKKLSTKLVKSDSPEFDVPGFSDNALVKTSENLSNSSSSNAFVDHQEKEMEEEHISAEPHLVQTHVSLLKEQPWGESLKDTTTTVEEKENSVSTSGWLSKRTHCLDATRKTFSLRIQKSKVTRRSLVQHTTPNAVSSSKPSAPPQQCPGPRKEGVSPRSDQDVNPRSDQDVSPRSKDVGPRSKDVGPRSKDVGPRRSKDVGPRSKDVGPRPHKAVAMEDPRLAARAQQQQQQHQQLSPQESDAAGRPSDHDPDCAQMRSGHHPDFEQQREALDLDHGFDRDQIHDPLMSDDPDFGQEEQMDVNISDEKQTASSMTEKAVAEDSGESLFTFNSCNGRRKKRKVNTRDDVTDDVMATRARAEVVDLTLDTPNNEVAGGGGDGDGGGVQCPVCGVLFPTDEVEWHAAECDGSTSDGWGGGGDGGNGDCSDGGSGDGDGDGVGGGGWTHRRYQAATQSVAKSRSAFDFSESEGGDMYCGEAGDSDSDYKPLDNDIQSYGEEEEGEGEGEEVLELHHYPQQGGSPPTTPPHHQLTRCEDGGFVVDPDTISDSPIKTYKRASDQQQRGGSGAVRYHEQFARKSLSLVAHARASQANSWGQADFGGSSSAVTQKPRSAKGQRRGTHRGGPRGGPRGRGRGYRGRGNRGSEKLVLKNR